MKKPDLFKFIAGIYFVATMVGSAAATTIHVTGVTGSPNGYPTIQSGIDSSSPGDTVLVHCGTYYEHNIEMSSGIVLRSATGEADCVTIDASDSGRGIWANPGSEIRVEGFRIENGIYPGGGGAMWIQNTDAKIKSCCFANNISGGVLEGFSGAVSLMEGSFEITDCVFTGNSSSYYHGAALTIYGGDAILTRCIVVDNEGDYGGGIGLANGTFEVRECYIADNYGQMSFGGLSVGSPLWWGGAQVSLLNSTITGNIGYSGGGAAIETGSELTAFNTDIRDNVGGDGFCAENSTTLLTCCDVVEGQWFIEEGAVLEVDNSGCGVATESMTWSRVKALYR